ncbi:Flp family type IVb pilin [Tepidibacillus marianensis]|uniref:Flp family type IVb pilin n=1 Tax=Tepidibacillus marianensis TaxID=3131995 RepID=UPI0030D4FB32
MRKLLTKLWVKQWSWKMSTKEALQNEEGQGMVEYGLIIALIAVVVIVALTAMGGNLSTMFNGVKDKLATP